jgi:hypothetical protein
MDDLKPVSNRLLKFECAWECIGCNETIVCKTLQVIVESQTGQPVECKTCHERYIVIPAGAIPMSMLSRSDREQWSPLFGVQ